MGPRLRTWNKTRARRVQRAWARIAAMFDPSPYPKGRETDWVTLDAMKRRMSVEEEIDAQQALDLLTTGLLALPWEYLPRKNRALYDGSACIDATPLPLSARGRAISDTVASTDPDGGWYVRTGDHNGDRAPIRKALWALDLHLIIASQPTNTGRQYIPALPIAMTASRPGADPAGAARRMLAALALFGHAPGYLAGDNLYTLANPVAFQQPAKEMGWSLVLPYPQGHTGKQGSSGGAPLVEGQWCCPAMPESLVAATEDFRAKRIDLATYRARIKKRNDYFLRAKESADPGRAQRFMCPAAGASPTAKCLLKPHSTTPRLIHHVGTSQADLRPRISPDNELIAAPPMVCRQQTITIKATEGAKYRQELPFGSEEHTTIYYSLREAQEGMHGYAKNDAAEALHAKGRRRAHGLAQNSIQAALLLACSGIRKVRSFLNEAVPDAKGILYKPVPNTRQRTPGSPGTETVTD